MKTTTIVTAMALAVSSSCAFGAGGVVKSPTSAAGAPMGGSAAAPMGTGGTPSPRVISPNVSPTTGMGTGNSTGTPPGLNANGPCNGASSTSGNAPPC
jgi:hypothetical protein